MLVSDEVDRVSDLTDGFILPIKSKCQMERIDVIFSLAHTKLRKCVDMCQNYL